MLSPDEETDRVPLSYSSQEHLWVIGAWGPMDVVYIGDDSTRSLRVLTPSEHRGPLPTIPPSTSSPTHYMNAHRVGPSHSVAAGLCGLRNGDTGGGHDRCPCLVGDPPLQGGGLHMPRLTNRGGAWQQLRFFYMWRTDNTSQPVQFCTSIAFPKRFCSALSRKKVLLFAH